MTEPKESNLLTQFNQQMVLSNISAQKATKWFQDNIKLISQDRLATASMIMTRDRQRLVPVQNIGPKLTGRMIMFFYSPKYRETLPVYDMFPLVLPIRFYTGKSAGFLGLNLHYLPINARAKLLDSIYTRYKAKHLDENKKLHLDYDMLNNSTKHKLFKPCVHRYLDSADNGGGVKSKFYLVDPNEWNMMLTLPTERFIGNTKEAAWRDSMKKLGISRW